MSYREDLQDAADLRAREIIEVFAHTRPDDTSCVTVIQQAGVRYSIFGENIAYGYRNPEEVMTGWMNSEGHRENILEEAFTGLAVGQATHNGVKYWVQLFIG